MSTSSNTAISPQFGRDKNQIHSTDQVHEPAAQVVSQAIARAVAMEPELAATPAHIRAGWLEQVANCIPEHAETLATAIVREGIKTIREARSEVNRARTTLMLCAEEAKRIGGEVVPFDQVPNGTGRTGWVSMRPVGLVAAITPFNDPLNLVAHKVGPAIAAGCPVILKPHEATPGPARMLLDLFSQHGLPENVFQILEGEGAETGKALVEHPDVKMVTFTGGKVSGEKVATGAGGRPTSLELGGVCSTIVLADADIETAAERIVSGMFAAAGQNCLHVQRVLVEEDIYQKMLEALLRLSAKIKRGDPMSESTDMGELIDEASCKRCAAFVDDAVSLGGRLVLGGDYSGKSFAPTLLVDVPEQARIYTEEVFGPVTVIEKIESIEDALHRLSSAGPSLSVAIFTNTLQAPFALRSLRTGSIMINDSTDFRVDAMPFGGPYPAGLAREGVQSAIQSMSEPQLMCFNLN